VPITLLLVAAPWSSTGNWKVPYNLAMTKPQKALPIFLTLALGCGSWTHGQETSEDEFARFEDNMLVLTRLSEQVTIDQLSIKTFRCRERIVVEEMDHKTRMSRYEESTHSYSVRRLPDKRVNERLNFSESRTPALELTQLPQVPLIDQPFTGEWLETFSFENRLANDFEKLPSEQIGGRECMVFAFETVSQISAGKIKLSGKVLPLRQRGRVWVDAASFQLVRLVAQQMKLPKTCRSYEYRIDFQPQSLFGRTMSIPARAELRLVLKDRTFVVVQDYSKFEAI
jgi:hypothetical protein